MSEPVSEETKRILREIGLTEYETRTYLSLLETGASTASRISEHANVPYSKIYETLNSLEKKGWIETQTGRPRRYYPKSPAKAIEATRLKLENMIKSWRRPILEELQPIYEKREIREKPDIWILRGEFNTIAKLQEMMENARFELMVAAPPLTSPLIEKIFPLIRNLGDLKLSIMISSEYGRQDLREIVKVAEVRVRDRMFGGGVIVDGREALLILGEGKPSLVIWSDHMGLVKFAKDYFQYLWNTAETINKT